MSPVHLTLCTTQDHFKKALKHLKVDEYDGVDKGSDATTHIFTYKDKCTAVVCVFKQIKDPVSRYGLLVHEAMHIWREVRTRIDEKNPSEEFEAYAMQAIFQELMEEMECQLGKRKR